MLQFVCTGLSDHDVVVVAVSDPQDVGGHAVASAGEQEPLHRLLELARRRRRRRGQSRTFSQILDKHDWFLLRMFSQMKSLTQRRQTAAVCVGDINTTLPVCLCHFLPRPSNKSCS